ncbi:MAG: acylphosphatase [Candidatus Aenigmatarchaeota archaeon]
MKAVKVRIFGKVQGVGFRYFLYKHAKSLNIKGYAKNLEDGSVEAVFEGSEENVEKMIELARKGPILAKVEKIEIEEIEPKNFKDFEIF